MPYKVLIEEKQDYIRVEVSGERMPGQEERDAKQVWSEVAAICARSGKRKILAIFTLRGKLPTLAAFSLGENPEEFGLERNFRIALIDLNEESREMNRFAETVAHNRGFGIAKVFDNEREGAEWLIGQNKT